jgi:hypothetical protein
LNDVGELRCRAGGRRGRRVSEGDAVRDAGMPLARAPVALLERLRERGPVMRRSELIDEDSLAERRSVDDLVREEDVQVFGVGEEVMVRLVEDDDPGSDA